MAHALPSFLKNTFVRIIFGATLILAIGLVAGWYGRIRWVKFNGQRLSIKQTRESASESKYEFINPLLTCDLTHKKDLRQFVPLKDSVTAIIQENIRQNNLQTASVYFDTRNGRWLDINPNEQYFPASLMKVPLMVAYLKAAETNPEILRKKIWYDGSFDLNNIEYFKASSSLNGSRSYTVDELLYRMIALSGNNSTVLLANNMEPALMEGIFNDLGVSMPAATDTTLSDYMTVNSYVNFFRILYNATYLSRPMSEKALGFLSKSEFSVGIRAGVPGTIKVASKFGERNNSTDPKDLFSDKQLHDCGIVYYPEQPYLLCIMTKGNDFDKLALVIKEISRTVYDFIDSQELARSTP
jgi:beta-lactamase class A